MLRIYQIWFFCLICQKDGNGEGRFFKLPSPRIKLISLELEFKVLSKVFNLSSLNSFWFSEIHSNSVFISFELKQCVNNITSLEYFLIKMSSIFRIQAVTSNSCNKELKLLLSIRFCKRNLKGMLLLTNKTYIYNLGIMFSCETLLLLKVLLEIQKFDFPLKNWHPSTVKYFAENYHFFYI